MGDPREGSGGQGEDAEGTAATGGMRATTVRTDQGVAAHVAVPADARALVERLRAAEARYQALATAAGQIIWRAAPDGQASDLPEWCAFTGQTPAEARGWGWLAALHPEDRVRIEHEGRAILAAGQPSELQYRLRRRDGQYRTVISRSAPVLDERGRVVEWVGVCTDVTERADLQQRTRVALDALLAMAEAAVQVPKPALAAAEAALGGDTDALAASGPVRRLGELTQRVLDCRRVGISAVDPATGLLRAVAVAGLPPEQEAQWWQEQRAAESRLEDSPDQDMIGRLRAGEVIVLDLTVPPYNAAPNPYQVADVLIAPLRIGDQLSGLLAIDYGGVPHDYSEDERALAGAVAKLAALVIERKRLLREREAALAETLALREANRRMDEFIGVAGHELRTPMTTIKANVQLGRRRALRIAQATDATSASAKEIATLLELLERAETATDRQERLVNDLLEISRIQEGRLEIRPAPCDLGDLVGDCVREQRLGHPARAIRYTEPRQPVMVLADPDRVTQVVTNYLTNALKYAPAERPITVRVDVRADTARVSVRDEGPGLPRVEQQRIWDRFYRSPEIERLNGAGIGLGLGLHISKTVVERHGGQVGVESRPGHGATFWFTLALAHTDAPTAPS